jgi:transposase
MMGRVYSQDLRQRIAKDISAGQSCRATGRKFGVSPSTAIRLGAAVREGKLLEPRKQGRPAGQGKLAPYTGFLLEAVQAKPDITLRELAEMLEARHDIKVSLPSIWRVLKMAGLTYKTYGPPRLQEDFTVF